MSDIKYQNDHYNFAYRVSALIYNIHPNSISVMMNGRNHIVEEIFNIIKLTTLVIERNTSNKRYHKRFLNYYIKSIKFKEKKFDK